MMVVSVRRATGFVGDGGDWRNASIVSLTARACGAQAFATSRAVAPIALTGRPTSVAADARPAKALEGAFLSVKRRARRLPELMEEQGYKPGSTPDDGMVSLIDMVSTTNLTDTDRALRLLDESSDVVPRDSVLRVRRARGTSRTRTTTRNGVGRRPTGTRLSRAISSTRLPGRGGKPPTGTSAPSSTSLRRSWPKWPVARGRSEALEACSQGSTSLSVWARRLVPHFFRAGHQARVSVRQSAMRRSCS
ncbi:hypothetical protein EES45_01500 [Streptomyces sp. ADI97-07]|nr:hypothetical protein EES45_01500 [Streptomyces sp. ADI97-07]